MFGFPSFAALRSCVTQSWSPEIGDPEITGWLTVIFYLLCFFLAVRVLMLRPRGAAIALWAVIAPITGFLAINKQLDLQSALTATGRCVAQAQGWYESRALVQVAFIAILMLAAICFLMIGLRILRGHLRTNGVALLGLAILCGYVLVRAVGFHHIDSLISMNVAKIRFNFLFENLGLLLIDLNAIFLLRRGRVLPRRAGVRPSRP
ncbi:hypothetical protein RGQ15_03225 [Paracoccus sp. MBLB3053]|uniref:Isopropylmalate isomerase n=1 Tax=Paracoccus aurantius TaxID=3073814 RepID=A0ABU2HPW6_9RHOB|nr:hypothetical protein [Paracoccus sp. MBLB3053]MDS9466590.1 hypothetical protein [Paracoccus sp. MBLB3053]